jgi:hypothetical protein
VRAREFVTESRVGSIQDDVARALPATYVLTKLENQDPYKQYRFGVAIAQAKGRRGREQAGEGNIHPFAARSAWGENQVVVSFDPNIEEWIDEALRDVGLSPNDKRLISTHTSEEAADVDHVSPIRPFAGYGR